MLSLLQNITEFELRLWTNNFRELWTFIKNIKKNPEQFLSNTSSNKGTNTLRRNVWKENSKQFQSLESIVGRLPPIEVHSKDVHNKPLKSNHTFKSTDNFVPSNQDEDDPNYENIIRKNVWRKDPKFESIESIISKQGLTKLHPAPVVVDSVDGYMSPKEVHTKDVPNSNNRRLNSNTDKLVRANQDEGDLDDAYLPPMTIKEKDVPGRPINTSHISPNNNTLHKSSSNTTRIPKKVIREDPSPSPTTYINAGSISQRKNSTNKTNSPRETTKLNIHNRKLPKTPDEEGSELISYLKSVTNRPLPAIPNTRNEVDQLPEVIQHHITDGSPLPMGQRIYPMSKETSHSNLGIVN